VSNVETAPVETIGTAPVAEQPVHELLDGREVVLGTRGLVVTRTLPHRDRRMVGAWCFVDAYGPESLNGGPGMRVPPHPHTGLQTVSWLVEGHVLHRDSIGSVQLVRPGELGLMTAGRAIAHSEQSPAERPPVLHGVQLWVALPEAHRHIEPGFEHHAALPVLTEPGVAVKVIMGELSGTASPASTYTPIVGAEVTLDAGASMRLPVRDDFEYATVVLSGEAEIDGAALGRGPLLYLGMGRTALDVRAPARPARVLVLGGEPFAEKIVMWWNFVARSHEEIVRDRDDWMAGRRFGVVRGYDGDPLPAPPMPATRLAPRGRRR
jgi:redox-sensitive bicupin YhaK (pirin superfamily)